MQLKIKWKWDATNSHKQIRKKKLELNQSTGLIQLESMLLLQSVLQMCKVIVDQIAVQEILCLHTRDEFIIYCIQLNPSRHKNFRVIKWTFDAFVCRWSVFVFKRLHSRSISISLAWSKDKRKLEKFGFSFISWIHKEKKKTITEKILFNLFATFHSMCAERA